ncbi:MAG TPA: glycosyltransferase family 2 protein [Myxococcota bacterium]|nr:glycosyltransferase family 2 protein [Myxococcota bacterium]
MKLAPSDRSGFDGVSRVFVVIPVFNRLALTRECIRGLRRQTFRSLEIIVADGGSTDGTPDVLRREEPGVVVLRSSRELWWTGATHMGIEYALAQSKGAGDFVLMMNNDTSIPDDFVEILVRVSEREGAAVGALIVDHDDRERILEAGVTICWKDYSFSARKAVEPGLRFVADVDVLPGRGTLVPIAMIRTIGNVDPVAFPHYIADYDFSLRLREAGFRLGVTCETRLASHVGETGLAPATGMMSFRQYWTQLTSRRSMANLRDHLRFIQRHAPSRLRLALQGRVLLGAAIALGWQTPLRFVWVFGFGYYPLPRESCRVAAADAAGCVDAGVLQEIDVPGWYLPCRSQAELHNGSGRAPRGISRAMQGARRVLGLRAWNPLTKPLRWRRLQGERRSRAGGRSTERDPGRTVQAADANLPE